MPEIQGGEKKKEKRQLVSPEQQKNPKTFTDSPRELFNLRQSDDSNDASCALGMCSCRPPPLPPPAGAGLEMIKMKTEALNPESWSKVTGVVSLLCQTQQTWFIST